MSLLHWSTTNLVIYTLVVTHITILGITIFLHRCQTHRSLTLHPVLSHFFRFWLWVTTSMGTKEWVAVHRKHHAKCETEEDPHSPVIFGIWNILFRGVHYYRRESHKLEVLEQYGVGTPDDWMERNVYMKYKYRAVVFLFFFNTVLFGFPGMIIWLTQMLWTPFWAAGVINGIGHWFGYRTFASKDTSTNIVPIGIIIGGEEFHNNHHAFPRSAKLSFRKGEFDIGWMYIRIFEILGLAKVLERSPAPEGVHNKFILSELFSVKMRSLRKYEKLVMQKVAKDQCDSSILNKVLHTDRAKFKKLWLRDRDLISKESLDYISNILSTKKQMESIYDLRNKLIEAWQGMGFSVNERIVLLNNWCNEAEKLGIECVDNFVEYLREKMPTTERA